MGGSALPCLVQSPIILPLDQRLSCGVAYMYKLWIHFLFFRPWPCLSICPSSSTEPVQWKHLPFLYHNHGFLSHLYTGSLEVCMGLCSQQYWCIDENLSLSYNPPPLNKFQTNSLMDPNKINLIGESFEIRGTRCQQEGAWWAHKLILPLSLWWTGLLMPQFPASYVDWLGHHIFESQTFRIGLG